MAAALAAMFHEGKPDKTDAQEWFCRISICVISNRWMDVSSVHCDSSLNRFWSVKYHSQNVSRWIFPFSQSICSACFFNVMVLGQFRFRIFASIVLLPRRRRVDVFVSWTIGWDSKCFCIAILFTFSFLLSSLCWPAPAHLNSPPLAHRPIRLLAFLCRPPLFDSQAHSE